MKPSTSTDDGIQPAAFVRFSDDNEEVNCTIVQKNEDLGGKGYKCSIPCITNECVINPDDEIVLAKTWSSKKEAHTVKRQFQFATGASSKRSKAIE